MKNFRIIFLFCLISIFFFSCKKNDDDCDYCANDFEKLMGKDLSTWQFVQTKEDFECLNLFKSIYEKNISLLKAGAAINKIPKKIHFIWLGPKLFPRDSVEHVRTWMAKHPDWVVKFWTDREDRPLPHPNMERVLVKDFKFKKLEDCFNKSNNYAEKSDILRYELLYQEGGVYVDHDVECFGCFDDLHSAYNFYCGIDLPFKTTLFSSVFPSNSIVASVSSHVILEKCIDYIYDNWDLVEKAYPGQDKESTIDRVVNRTYAPLGYAYKEFNNRNGFCDMIFPSYYFHPPEKKYAILAWHKYSGKWFENETFFEKNTREKLMKLCKKSNKNLLILSIMFSINLVWLSTLTILRYRPKSSSK